MSKYLKTFAALLATLCLICTLSGYFIGIPLPWAQKSDITPIELFLSKQMILDSMPIYLEFDNQCYLLEASEPLYLTDIEIDKLSFIDWLKGKPYTSTVKVNCNCNAVYEAVTALKQKEPKNAEIVVTETGINLIPEKYELAFDTDLMVKYVIENIENSVFNIDVKEVLHDPEVTSDDLRKDYEDLQWLNDYKIEYGMVTIDKTYLLPFINNNKFKPTDELYADIISELEAAYNTKEKSMQFQTTTCATVEVPYGTFGKCVDTEAETEFLKEVITKHTSVSGRRPELIGYDELGASYIEVDIHNQHVYHYIEGELCCDTPTVTGHKGRHDTPVGVYYVSECIPGKYLVGDTYRTWVNRWMRLTNSGIGLHDATWRGSFGKNIYTYNGSHGCINLPNDYAHQLYKEIGVGTPVIIHDTPVDDID